MSAHRTGRRRIGSALAVARRRQTQKNLRRRAPQRESYERVLNICEGRRSETGYFLGLVDEYRLSTVNIRIKGIGKDPSALVQEAIDLQKQERELGEEYDQIFCVFDKDRHHHFELASERAAQKSFKLARSWPCFEYWLLLHFEFSRKPYEDASNTPCENCTKDLKRHIPDYEKNTAGLFQDLAHSLELAKKHAIGALKDAAATGNPNPSTEVHFLVEHLQSLRR